MKEYDAIIVGGGVSGTALLYVLSQYTNIGKILLIEKYSKVAQVNSKRTNNSQTLHFGDIETNYKLEKAKKVKQGEDMVRRYIEREQPKTKKKLFSKYNKMVLAVGKEQVIELKERYHSGFDKLFPNLKMIGKQEIKKLEPRILEGRDPKEELLALSSKDGYTMDFGAVAENFVQNSKKKNNIEIKINTLVNDIKETKKGFHIKTSKGEFKAKTVIVTAGGHTPLIAEKMGYAKNISILSIAGSFFFAPKALNGKVYTLQNDKLPFAAIHGDPDVIDQKETRFGPTAKAILQLERYNGKSFFEYWRVFKFNIKGFHTILKLFGDWTITNYILTNLLYDIPFFGRMLFLKEVKKIVPNIQLNELRYAKKNRRDKTTNIEFGN